MLIFVNYAFRSETKLFIQESNAKYFCAKFQLMNYATNIYVVLAH